MNQNTLWVLYALLILLIVCLCGLLMVKLKKFKAMEKKLALFLEDCRTCELCQAGVAAPEGEEAGCFSPVKKSISSANEALAARQEKITAASDSFCDFKGAFRAFDDNFRSDLAAVTKNMGVLKSNCRDYGERMKRIADRSTNLFRRIEKLSVIAGGLSKRGESNSQALSSVQRRINIMEDKVQTTKNSVEKLSKKTSSLKIAVYSAMELSERLTVLALQASVELERAGARDKGCIVLAEELRKLARENRNAAFWTTQTFEELSHDVAKSTQDLQQLLEFTPGIDLTEIIAAFGRTGEVEFLENVMSEISDMTRELDGMFAQIHRQAESIVHLSENSSIESKTFRENIELPLHRMAAALQDTAQALNAATWEFLAQDPSADRVSFSASAGEANILPLRNSLKIDDTAEGALPRPA